MAALQASPEPNWLRIVEWALSFVGGAGAAFVFFRTRLALIERQLDTLVQAEKKREAEATQRAADERNDDTVKEMRVAAAIRDAVTDAESALDTRLRTVESRLTMLIRLLADIAKQVGVEKRFTDDIVTMLADDAVRRPRIHRND